jgi:outer membrane biosynthesis protein TonB
MLEDAGYDVKNAEYKAGKHLRSVEILFKVSSPGTAGMPRLEDVLIESSSGYSDIDAAVLYGFKKAEFSNSGSNSVSGRFTYRF